MRVLKKSAVTKSKLSRAMSPAIERRVLSFIARNDVFSRGERAVVAVSGGPDSTALLLLLARMTADLGISLMVAHFDHRLRSRDEAAADREYVAALAGRLGLRFVAGSGDVRRRARRMGESLEEAARRMRYRFLAREARAAEARVVVTGHTMDDQAETLMLHLVRGSGLAGLAGMRGRAQWPFGRGPDIARPLLCLSRPEIEVYCGEAGVEPRRDPTNDVPGPTRNRIRLRVIPELRAINPRAVEALARLADSVAADAEYLDSAAQRAAEGLTFERRSVRLPRGYLNSLPGAMAGRLVRMAVAHTRGSRADLEATHVEAVLALAKGRPGQLALPHGVNVEADPHILWIGRGVPERARRIPETPIATPGVTLVPGWRIESAVTGAPADLRSVHPLEAFVALAAVEGGLTVRSRRPGDRLRPLGLRGVKKLQDVLVDAKVPVWERDGVPIVCGPWGIAWVAGHCVDERAAVGPATGKVVHMRLERLVEG